MSCRVGSYFLIRDGRVERLDGKKKRVFFFFFENVFVPSSFRLGEEKKKRIRSPSFLLFVVEIVMCAEKSARKSVVRRSVVRVRDGGARQIFCCVLLLF